MQKQWQAGGDWTLMDPSFVQRVRNEVDILGHLGRSLNVCYYYGAYECEEYVYLVMELCSGGQLWDRWGLGGRAAGRACGSRLARPSPDGVRPC